MGFDVKCGTKGQCYNCPFIREDEQRAQELGKIAACFEEEKFLPNHKTVGRVAELTGKEIDRVTAIKIRKAIVQMTLSGHCVVKENNNGKDI